MKNMILLTIFFKKGTVSIEQDTINQKHQKTVSLDIIVLNKLPCM